MGFITWADGLTKKMNMYDWGVLKTVMVLFGIIIGAYISDIVKANIWFFAVPAIALYAYLLYKVFR